MGKKITPERVAGIVALSYLVLLPAGAFWVYKKITTIDRDLTTMWDVVGMEEEKTDPSVLPALGNFKRIAEGLKRSGFKINIPPIVR